MKQDEKNRVIESSICAISVITVALSRLMQIELLFYVSIVSAVAAVLLSFRTSYRTALFEATILVVLIYSVKYVISDNALAWILLIVAALGLVWEMSKFVFQKSDPGKKEPGASVN